MSRLLFTILFFISIAHVSGQSSYCANTIFTSTAAIAANNCTTIKGLILNNSNETNLNALYYLTQVLYVMDISDNLYLKEIVMPNFFALGGDSASLSLTIKNNPILESIILVNLYEVISLAFSPMQIWNNTALQSIDLPNFATTSGMLDIAWNPMLLQINYGKAISIIDESILVINNTDSSSVFCDSTAPGSFYVAIRCNSKLQQFQLNHLSIPGEFNIQNNGYFTSLIAPVSSIGDLVVLANPALFEIQLPELRSITGNLQFISNSNLASVQLPQLNTISGFVTVQNNDALLHLNWLGLVTIIGGSVLIDNNSNLTSISGLYVNQLSNLTISNNMNIQNLQGLNVPLIINNLIIDSNNALSSLLGLQSLNRVYGQLSIRNNPLLVDYSALSNLAVMPVPADASTQCCPSYSFFESPYIFTRVSFSCKICTSFQSIIPSSGAITGGTIVNVTISGTSPAPWLLFQFGDSPSINCSLSTALSYQCVVPASTSSIAQSIPVLVSFDIGTTYQPTTLSFTYVSWNTLTGQQDGIISPTDSLSISTKVDGLNGIPNSQSSYASFVQDQIIYAGFAICGLIIVIIYLLWSCFHSKELPTQLSSIDYVRFSQRDTEQSVDKFDFKVHRQTTVLGGIVTVLSLIMCITLVTAYLAQALLNNEQTIIAVSQSSGRKVPANVYSSSIILNNLNGQCTLTSSNLCSNDLYLQSIGYSKPGQFSCQSIPNPDATLSNCQIDWICTDCVQVLGSANLQVQHSDPNAFITGFTWQSSVLDYFQTQLVASGSAVAPQGTILQGSASNIIPLTVTPSVYQYYNNPVQTGLALDQGSLIPGSLVSRSNSGSTGQGFTVAIQMQQSTTWLQVTIQSQVSNLTILAALSALIGAVWKIATLLVSAAQQRVVQSCLRCCFAKCYPCNKWIRRTKEQEIQDKSEMALSKVASVNNSIHV